jgi:16S rRNA (adenine1518-N6/adenine1519-N6)-dimethyltransferase
MKLTTLKETLGRIHVTPAKTLGQNFLHDQNLAEWIVDQLELKPSDHVVELGPGLGALTEYIVPHCASVTLVEKDGRLADYLRERFADAGIPVDIRHEDAIAFDLRPLFLLGPIKVLGNLPYYVSSQILLNFTAEPTPVSRLVFTLQKELAQRLSAEPSTKEYGALTLMIQRRWRVKYLRTIPGSAFLPPPKVDSAVVSISRRLPDEVPDCDGSLFNTLVKQGFSQRRKQLRKLLVNWNLDWPGMMAKLGLPEAVRAEALSLGQWVELTNFVARTRGALVAASEAAQDVHGEMFDVVDEENRVIRQASRFEVHRDRLSHRAVHIFVFNKSGELFLQKRSRWKDMHPGRWDSSASGHLNAGQDYDETAVRELQEELGVESDVEFILDIPASRETGREFVRLYRAEHRGPFRLPPAEIECGGFFPLHVVDRWMVRRPDDFSPAFRYCYGLYKEAMDQRGGKGVGE